MRKKLYTTLTIWIMWAILFPALQSSNAQDYLEIDNPQSVSVAVTGEGFTCGEKRRAIFTVSSNNGFDISFSGDSPQDNFSVDGNYGYPVFTKQDVDASGTTVQDRYDHLQTSFGIVIDKYDTVGNADNWGDGASANGDPVKLVRDRTEEFSPHAVIGRIMPLTGTAEVHLYAKGEATQDRQSGIYSMEIMCTVTADPQ